MPDGDRLAQPDSLLRDQFPVLASGLYLNHAAIGPWPRCAAEAMQEFAAENMLRGPADYRAWIQRESALRSDLARLIGAGSKRDVALLKNTTEGISTVAWGLDWRPGDNVVLPLGEFPSNRLPWLAQSACGVATREVDIRAAENAEGALIEAMDDDTRLLSVSAVQWSDGFRLDLRVLGESCRERGVLFFVDAIQQLGALPIDVEACHIDFLAADAHKWLLGPEGIAVFYASERSRPLLRLRQQGWHMFDDPWNFQREGWAPALSARRFEAGSPNSAGQAAMHASVRLLLEQGSEFIADRVLANTDYLVTQLPGVQGLQLTSCAEPERRSGIVSFSCAGVSAHDLCRRLAANGVACAVRERAVRVSPHFYQGPAELQRFLELLEAAL